MDRTLRAALLAASITFVPVAGLGAFLGFDPVGSIVVGLVLAVLAAVLILGAARRASTFEPTPPTPGFPGPPEPRDGAEQGDQPGHGAGQDADPDHPTTP